MNDKERPCGAIHPERPSVACERILCAVYHRNGRIIWAQGAAPLPTNETDPVRMTEIIRRAKEKGRR